MLDNCDFRCRTLCDVSSQCSRKRFTVKNKKSITYCYFQLNEKKKSIGISLFKHHCLQVKEKAEEKKEKDGKNGNPEQKQIFK